MGKKTLHKIILAACLVLTCVATEFPEGKKKITLTELLTFGDEENGIIYQWVSLVTDPQGNIYLTDLKDFSLKKFNRRGKFMKKTGKRGQGPGEFQTPGKIRYFKGNVYVAEIQNPGIQIFDTDLNFQRRIPTSVPFTDFQVIDEAKIAAATLNSKSILIFDHTGTRTGTLQYTRQTSFMLNSVCFILKGDAYYLSFKWQDLICKLSLKGDLIWTKKLFGRKKTPLKKIRNIKVPRQVVYKTIALDNNGIIYVLGGDWSLRPSRDVYLLSQNGRLIGEITLPEATHTLHVDRNNYLYSRSAYGTLVKKYRVGLHD